MTSNIIYDINVPQDIWIEIIEYLEPIDILHLNLVCLTLLELRPNYLARGLARSRCKDNYIKNAIETSGLMTYNLPYYPSNIIEYNYKSGNIFALTKSETNYIKLASYGHLRLVKQSTDKAETYSCVITFIEHGYARLALDLIFKRCIEIDQNILTRLHRHREYEVLKLLPTSDINQCLLSMECYLGLKTINDLNRSQVLLCRTMEAACAGGHLDFVEHLIARGNSHIQPGLMSAIKHNRIHVATYLLDLVGDITTNLILVATSIDMIKLIIDRRPIPEDYLYLAIINTGNIDLIKLTSIPSVMSDFVRGMLWGVAKRNKLVFDYLVDCIGMQPKHIISVGRIAVETNDIDLLIRVMKCCAELGDNILYAVRCQLYPACISSGQIGSINLIGHHQDRCHTLPTNIDLSVLKYMHDNNICSSDIIKCTPCFSLSIRHFMAYKRGDN